MGYLGKTNQIQTMVLDIKTSLAFRMKVLKMFMNTNG